MAPTGSFLLGESGAVGFQLRVQQLFNINN